MSIKESALASMTNSEFTASDYVRVLDGNTSRKITLQEFTESIDPLLVAEGFIKTAPSTDVAIRTVTANTTLDAETDQVILVDTTSGNVTVTLPAANLMGTGTTGTRYTVKSKVNSGNKVTVATSGGALIDGAAFVDIFGLNSITFVSDSFNVYTV